jgi:hypothetical protein
MSNFDPPSLAKTVQDWITAVDAAASQHSSGLYRFLAIAVLLDVKDIPQVGPLQWRRINAMATIEPGSPWENGYIDSFDAPYGQNNAPISWPRSPASQPRCRTQAPPDRDHVLNEEIICPCWWVCVVEPPAVVARQVHIIAKR